MVKNKTKKLSFIFLMSISLLNQNVSLLAHAQEIEEEDIDEDVDEDSSSISTTVKSIIGTFGVCGFGLLLDWYFEKGYIFNTIETLNKKIQNKNEQIKELQKDATKNVDKITILTKEIDQMQAKIKEMTDKKKQSAQTPAVQTPVK
jgi:hypothetical protein